MDPLPPKNRHIIEMLAPFVNDRREPKTRRMLIRRLIRRFMQKPILKRRKP